MDLLIIWVSFIFFKSIFKRLDLLQYFIEESVFIPKDGKNAIVIKIGFGRRFMNVMLTAILPAILIDMVCFLK